MYDATVAHWQDTLNLIKVGYMALAKGIPLVNMTIGMPLAYVGFYVLRD